MTEEDPRRDITSLVGLLLFMGTMTMFFTALTGAFLVRRTGPDWDPVKLPQILWMNTAPLLGVSLALEAGRRWESRPWVPVGFGLGMFYLLGQGAGWYSLRAAEIYVSTGAHAAFFYLFTGLHGLLVAGGLIALGRLLPRPEARVDLAAYYWHFLTVTGIFQIILVGGVQ